METQFPIIPILVILVIVAVVIGVVLGARYIAKAHKRSKTHSDKISKIWYAIIIISVVIMFFSWIFNMGWYRFILIWIPIPFIHTIAFSLSTSKLRIKYPPFKV